MKTRIIRISAMAVMFFATTTVSAQISLGDILNKVKDATSNSADSTKSTSSSTAGNILSGLTSIFNANKVATIDNLAGTWQYVEPAVVFKSDNVLKSAGGKIAAATMEKKLQTQLEKYGIKKGKMSMTFAKDSTFTQTISGKTLKGTFSLDGKNVELKYAGKVKQMVGTTQVDGNSLLIVMDVSKLLTFMNTIGSLSGNSTLKTAGSLLGSMDGMQCGLKLEK